MKPKIDAGASGDLFARPTIAADAPAPSLGPIPAAAAALPQPCEWCAGHRAGFGGVYDLRCHGCERRLLRDSKPNVAPVAAALERMRKAWRVA